MQAHNIVQVLPMALKLWCLDELNLRRGLVITSKSRAECGPQGANDSWLVNVEPNLKSNRFLILAMTSEA